MMGEFGKEWKKQSATKQTKKRKIRIKWKERKETKQNSTAYFSRFSLTEFLTQWTSQAFIKTISHLCWLYDKSPGIDTCWKDQSCHMAGSNEFPANQTRSDWLPNYRSSQYVLAILKFVTSAQGLSQGNYSDFYQKVTDLVISWYVRHRITYILMKTWSTKSHNLQFRCRIT